ncbi:hypothetical protein CVD28_01635 [Bacillus sp. M6-12]|uniref:toxic anion resistance protein n=1 Tax=Bacillus sp. M6-12 TaxID=2054166 RepID=UPI000C789BCA|nr:toxic anion resistance protein [Bacillus sp. M6-12]PLS19135.1 hypothetical protein CVD28_01635 [Bacillus sp. M6-12]
MLQFDRPQNQSQTLTKTAFAEPLEVKQELVPIDINTQTTAVVEKVKNSPEVQALVRQIDISNTQSLMAFGKNASEEVASFADSILRTMERTKTEDAGQMILQLKKIMDTFDIKDFEKQNPGFLEKLFNRAKNTIEEIFKKYHSMGDDVDKVHIQLRQYEAEINKANDSLDEMFDRNLTYYEELQKYIVAGEMASEELATSLIPEWEQRANQTGDQYDRVTVQNLHQAKDMIDQRVYDLRLAENIALQSMPMIKSIQFGNYNLVRKINSAFVITLPVFKQSLAQAIMLKRQAVQAKALKALDDTTNELLLKNAQNTALQSKMTAQLATGSFVQIETLQKTWETIMQGIEETKQITVEGQRKRKEETLKLEEFKKAYEQKRLT